MSADAAVPPAPPLAAARAGVALRDAALCALVAVAAFFAFAFLLLRFPVLYDSDSYFHLAAARLYAHGIPHQLPWARFSLMHDGWGDKELLFHLALLPFATGMDAAVGGRVALAACNAALCGLLAFLGLRAIGRWGLLVPLLVYVLPAGFLPRAVRLRPELLALFLLLLAIHYAGQRRHLALAGVAFVFALAYTAWHVLPGLALVWALWDRLVGRRWDWRLALSPSVGTALGVLAHPQLPKNLEVWWAQNVRYYQLRGHLDVGDEAFAPGPARMLLDNAPLLLALAALWLAARPVEPDEERTGPPLDRRGPYFALSAAFFTVLYVLMGRMVTYAAPLAVLAVAFGIRHRGRRVTSSLSIGRLRVRLAVPLLLAGLAALPGLRDPTLLGLLRAGTGPFVTEADLEGFGRGVPAGAKVAATWEDAESYAFWAPQGRYLNVLDPVFMALPHPREYALQQRLFAGAEPDVPLSLALLDSDHLAFDRTLHPALLERLRGDPRLVPLYAGYNVLLRRSPAPNRFVLDWAQPASGRRYPRLAEPRRRAAEAFVDLRRLREAAPCPTVAHRFFLDAPTEIAFTFAPWGSGTLALDGTTVAQAPEPRYAVLGRGVAASARLAAGRHEILAKTCAQAGLAGFYLRRDR